MDHGQQVCQPSSSSTKVERKIVEKIRRNHMKNLFSKLNSLLPKYNHKETLPLPDQVDEAINYIKILETNVKLVKEKKEGLMENKRSHSDCSSSSEAKRNIKSPKIEIHEMGSSLQIIITCGVDDQFIFCEIIRILHEENLVVITANSSVAGDSIFHIVNAEIPQSLLQFGATKVSERLKRFVNGSGSGIETEPQLWDFEIGTRSWELLDSIVTKSLSNP
ncbi:transcription factor bHLH162-like [Trifolium pratense]|uniref:transcription factor bHLH162-like n=1 Tax=Trifolium pratense TaxID=57577 RepID=UPI001E697E01|nr:transcription factor bHLH162-like [Trifolium pratense]